MALNIQILEENPYGRDFVVGDIHGMFHLLDQAMANVNFDPAQDRIISVGDLVNRGPQSHRVLDFLCQPWFHAVRGNHEEKIIRLINDDGTLDNLNSFFNVESSEMSWLYNLPKAERLEIKRAFQLLPIAIETQKQGKTIGFVHADVPLDMNWGEFKNNLKNNDRETLHQAMWGRTRIKAEDERGVDGVDRVFLGHTVRKKITAYGNCVYVETGASKRYLTGKDKYHLTLADISLPASMLSSRFMMEKTAVHAVQGKASHQPWSRKNTYSASFEAAC